MKILYVEDEAAHVLLTERTLEENLQQEFRLIHAETILDALHILDSQPDIDLILSDLRLPDGTGLDLLNQVRSRRDPPAVVLVTAQGDQEVAVAALKAGAADYLVKQSDYLHRLPVVISHAIAQNRYVREQEALHRAEVKYQALLEQIPAVVFLDEANEEQTPIYMSPRIEELTGYPAEEWCTNPNRWISSIHPDDRERIAQRNSESDRLGSRFLEEYRIIRRDGKIVWVKEDTNLIRDKQGNPLYWQGILLNVTKEKEDEAALQRQLEELAVLHSASLAAANASDIDQLIEQVTNVIGNTLCPDNFGILLFDQVANTLKPHRSYRGTSLENLSMSLPVTRGITGKVARTGIPMRLGDLTKEAQYVEVARGVRAELCVPIIARGQTIGVINAESKKPNAYSERDERLLITVANTLATATEKLRSFEEARHRARELEALYRASRLFGLSLEPQVIGQSLIKTMDDLLGYEFASVHLLQAEKGVLIPLAVNQKAKKLENYIGDEELIRSQRIRLGTGIVGWVAQHAQSSCTGDVTKDSRYLATFKNIRSELCVPLMARDKVVGVLNIQSTQLNAYSERDESLLTALANSAAVALENARFYQDALRTAERRAVLHRISQDIVRFNQDPEQIYTAIHEATSKLMPCDIFIIRLRDEKEKQIIPVFTVADGKRVELARDLDNRELTATVMRSGQSLILRNHAEIEQSKVVFLSSLPSLQSVVAVPLRIGSQIIGMISSQSYEPYSYDVEEQALLEMLATHAATAIENNRLFISEQKRRREAETLRQAASVISSTLDPDEVVEKILVALKQVIPYDSATVFFHEGDQLRVAMTHGYPHADELANQAFPADDKLFQSIRKTLQPVILPDAQRDPRFKKWGESSQIRGWMGIPLIVHGKVIGAISLDSHEPGAYDEAVVETAMAFANQAAAGIANAWLFEEQIRRSQIIEALAAIANEIATTREVVPALEQITRRALDLLNANNVAIYLLQEDNVTLKIIAASGRYENKLLGHTRKIGEGITSYIFLHGKPEIIRDTSEDSRRVTVPGTPEKEERLDSLMSSPLIVRGRTIGVINAWRQKEDGLFNETELNFLVGIAHQASICIESGRLFEETIRQAKEAAAIAEVGRDISATLQLDRVLERIAFYAMDLLHAETSAVYLADPATSTLRAIAALGLDAEAIKNDPLTLGTGILGSIAAASVGEIVNEAASDSRTIIVKGTELNPLEHIMGVPIVLKDKPMGLLSVWRSGIGAEFASRELEFLTSLARQAAVAIENARLFDEAQRRLRELEIINRVSTLLRVAQSVDEMLPILLNETLQLLDTPHGSIWLYEPITDMLVQRVGKGMDAGLQHTSLAPMEGIIGYTFGTGKIYLSSELKSDSLVSDGNRASIAFGLSGACIPIQSTAGPVGVIATAIEKGRQISDEIKLLTILSEIAGNSIHRAQLYDQSQRQVRRLTSLHDIDSAIASSFDLRLTLNILLDHTRNHLSVDAVNIGLYYPDLRTLTYLPGVGFNIPSPTRPQVRIGEGLAGQVILKQRTLVVPDLQNAPEASKDHIIKHEGFVNYIGVPLIVKGQIKGVFEIFHRSSLSPTPDWMEFLHTLAGQAAIAIDSSQLFENLQRSNQELIQAYDTTLEGWARALELRDRETEGHTRRVTELTIRLARYIGVRDSELVNIRRGVLLHDIGKMGVPDRILKKKGELTKQEWAEMCQHPVYAYNLLSPISFLRRVLDIPYCHHEHWDGGGYPRGLKGEQIPLAARIFAVVDNWDALLSDRPYRKAWEREKVIAYLKESAGRVLDPKIVEIFLRMIEEEQAGGN